MTPHENGPCPICNAGRLSKRSGCDGFACRSLSCLSLVSVTGEKVERPKTDPKPEAKEHPKAGSKERLVAKNVFGNK